MKLWEKLSPLARYYVKYISGFMFCYGVFHVLDVALVHLMFFSVAYIWHFTLQTPGVKEKMLVKKTRFSFLSIVVRVNYYLQLFLPTHKIPFGLGSALVRTISPLIFIFILKVVGGTGNILFALLGSAVFELIYFFADKKKKIISVLPDDPEIPPAIPNAEISRE